MVTSSVTVRQKWERGGDSDMMCILCTEFNRPVPKNVKPIDARISTIIIKLT